MSEYTGAEFETPFNEGAVATNRKLRYEVLLRRVEPIGLYLWPSTR